jgi:predicted dithiol-disulfide oxidoreductase (DUF899 family)
MDGTRLVSREEWLEARKALLIEEKEFTHARDQLSKRRRDLPMVRVDKAYRFETERGEESLADLFKGKSQLIIVHFMFGADWEQGCPSCSFWADHYSGIDVHLAARDTSLVCVSNAPLPRLLAYRERMGWRLDWASAARTSFSADFGVTFPGKKPGPTGGYNYTDHVPFDELPGVSVFAHLNGGTLAHSYSTYARGLDILNTAYHLLDMTPKGRDEDALPHSMAWLRRRDQYDAQD